ncbi:hypothetical protein [Anaeromyxobacter sp. SG66]|uniref:hypothetical protein n=1 Tax=Anaeromyxobacter sp. SG66 TaxID=2925410 RepID=UPI001F575877|nr:hypothetical protein [Anaeromyxobacter sp. SG66]
MQAGPTGRVDQAPALAVRAGITAVVVALVTLPPLLVSEFPSGDLHSHVYNAWLALLIERGEAGGLWLAAPTTNVLVDRVLGALVRVLTPGQVEKVALVATAHLSLWSSFLFCRALSARPAWEWLPVLGMLALGWNFHMGLSNWTAAASLSLLAGAAVLSSARWPVRLSLAAPLLALAVTGSPLPVAGVGAATALALAVRERVARPGVLLAAALGVEAAAAAALGISRRSLYSTDQWATVSGADQLWVFDAKYRLFMLALLALWAVVIRRWLREVGNAALEHPVFAVAVLATASGVILPDAILFPGFDVPASYLVQRSSVLVGIAWTGVAACAPRSGRQLAATIALAACWVATLSLDWTALSSFQGQVNAAARELPRGSRIVGAIASPPSRVAPFTHVVDRACAGRCFAWGNYEPSSTAFRIRAAPGNGIVVAARGDFADIELGGYRAPELSFPIWTLRPCTDGRPAGTICASILPAGGTLELACLDPFAGPGKPRFSRCERTYR